VGRPRVLGSSPSVPPHSAFIGGPRRSRGSTALRRGSGPRFQFARLCSVLRTVHSSQGADARWREWNETTARKTALDEKHGEHSHALIRPCLTCPTCPNREGRRHIVTPAVLVVPLSSRVGGWLAEYNLIYFLINLDGVLGRRNGLNEKTMPGRGSARHELLVGAATCLAIRAAEPQASRTSAVPSRVALIHGVRQYPSRRNRYCARRG